MSECTEEPVRPQILSWVIQFAYNIGHHLKYEISSGWNIIYWPTDDNGNVISGQTEVANKFWSAWRKNNDS